MAVTPPLRIPVQTPPTPRYGPLQDHYPNASRHSARLADKRRHRANHSTPDPQSPVKSRSGQNALVSTPASSSRSSRTSNNNLSPPQSNRGSPKRRSARRVHIVSPDSPIEGLQGSVSKTLPPSQPSHQPHSTFLTATTTATGMLPTPVKTPKKKKMAGNVNAPARTLFDNQPITGEEVEVTAPKRSRKGRKYNGFSLESFSTEDDGQQGGIQIYTDSKEKVPELDLSEENPFIDHAAFDRGSSSKVGGTSKRRKVSGSSRKDKDVEEALRKDEGMVYVFRGRKLYRKFNDSEDASEAAEAESPIDVSDLGLLAQSGDHTPTQIRQIRPLTRKSVKPTRLFQSEKQKRDREARREEEIITDIEEDVDANSSSPTLIPGSGLPNIGRRSRSDVPPPPSALEEGSDDEKPSEVSRKKGKKVSPFDSWRRVKKGSGESDDVAKTTATAPTMGKGKKRDFDAAVEANGEQVIPKRTRG